MKRILFILCIITSSLIFTSCKTVILTSADQVVSSSWSVTNPAGVSAKLSFDVELYSSCLEISDTAGNRSVIKGTFAIDPQNLYITSSNFGRTYCFGYKVYTDRLELKYNNTVLTFFSDTQTTDKKTEP